jgi:hypothetical protein
VQTNTNPRSFLTYRLAREAEWNLLRATDSIQRSSYQALKAAGMWLPAFLAAAYTYGFRKREPLDLTI